MVKVRGAIIEEAKSIAINNANLHDFEKKDMRYPSFCNRVKYDVRCENADYVDGGFIMCGL